jgi:hypothetical protein
MQSIAVHVRLPGRLGSRRRDVSCSRGVFGHGWNKVLQPVCFEAVHVELVIGFSPCRPHRKWPIELPDFHSGGHRIVLRGHMRDRSGVLGASRSSSRCGVLVASFNMKGIHFPALFVVNVHVVAGVGAHVLCRCLCTSTVQCEDSELKKRVAIEDQNGSVATRFPAPRYLLLSGSSLV